jgi:hypothetical protein
MLVRFAFLMTMHIMLVWDVAPCSLVDFDQCFSGAYGNCMVIHPSRELCLGLDWL